MAKAKPSIGIWGPSGAGKTTYLAALELAMSRLGYGAQGWSIGKDAAAQRYLAPYRDRLLTEGVFPPPTDPLADPQKYGLTFKRADKSGMGYQGRRHQVTFVDAAGELILGRNAKSQNFFSALAEARGIALMIDPDPPNRQRMNYYPVLNLLLDKLEASGKRDSRQVEIEGYFAFCVTKADVINGAQETDPEDLFIQYAGADTHDLVKGRCEHVAFFTISVAGNVSTVDGTYSNIEPTYSGGGFKLRDLEQWQPQNLMDPLFWLFDRLEDDNDRQLAFWRRWLRRSLREPNLG